MFQMEPRADLIHFKYGGVEYAMTKQEIEAAYQYQWRQNQLEDALRQLNTLVFGCDDGSEFNDPEDAKSKSDFEEIFGISYEEAISPPMLEKYLRQFDSRFDCNVDENSQWEAAIKAVLKARRCA